MIPMVSLLLLSKGGKQIGLVQGKECILTHLCLGVPRVIDVRIYSTFDSNYGIKNDFTKYLKKSCWLWYD